uniref:Uncharacterized protein n=1 Tax=viral metagenome TaxID=1070528 RepID=A0A6C0ARL0_9ZZZZ
MGSNQSTPITYNTGIQDIIKELENKKVPILKSFNEINDTVGRLKETITVKLSTGKGITKQNADALSLANSILDSLDDQLHNIENEIQSVIVYAEGIKKAETAFEIAKSREVKGVRRNSRVQLPKSSISVLNPNATRSIFNPFPSRQIPTGIQGGRRKSKKVRSKRRRYTIRK